MTRRLAKKVSREWTAFDIGDRKKRPRYTRDMLGLALDYAKGTGRKGKFNPGPWSFSRRGKAS